MQLHKHSRTMFRPLLLHAVVFAAALSMASAASPDSTHYTQLRWRMIGPHRAGRTVAAVGVPEQPNLFYIGVNNGGVWKSDDYGRTWTPIFDKEPTGSIGAIGIAPSNPSILYVGSGEGLQRPDLSVGDGMFKSTDAGATWKFVGLGDAQQIGAVQVDPRDANRVYVAVLGHPYGPNKQRGVYRTTDGGASWQSVLYKDENTGAIGLVIDPANPDRIYATLWSARQGPWENGAWGGKTSGLFRSNDGGTTWEQLTGGLPTGDQGVGRIGIAVSPSEPGRLYALVDARDLSGVYRSDDMGAHWQRTNSEGRVCGRGDDFAEIKVDPRNSSIVYAANTALYKSTDAGMTFRAIKGAPGGDDYHTIWVNPLRPEIMLIAADQGAVVTVNGGRTWSSWYNQPTAQFYHVITDNEFPYNVYGGQQESGSVGIVSRGNDGQITFREWHPVAADEWAYVAPDPLNPDIIYGGKVTRYNKRTGLVQNVAPEAIRSGKYRYLRTSPLMFSPVDQHALYLAGNVLFKTTNAGFSWDIISPDLTREHPGVPENIGIFRTPDLANQPRRGVIYALGLSPVDKNVLWAGTDDGLVHVSWDGGGHWSNVTPTGLTSWSKVAGIDAGHSDIQTAYIAVNRFRLDDLRPHIYRTHDGGKSWKEIVAGLPAGGPVNAVREDPKRPGLLFAGTERAVYVSFDDGDHWLPLRLNMPATSIRDLVVHENDVVVGTHGRSFWVLDDISALRQLGRDVPVSQTALFAPALATRVRWSLNTDTPLPPDEPGGENPPDGAIIDYYLAKSAKSVTLEIYDKANTLVRRYASDDPPDTVIEKDLHISMDWVRPQLRLSAEKGSHRFLWDMRFTPPPAFQRSYPMSAIIHNTPSQPVGPWVLPARYTVLLTVDGKRFAQPIDVRIDPRVHASDETLAQQFDLSYACYHGLGQINGIRMQIDALRKQIHQTTGRLQPSALKDSLTAFGKRLDSVEGGIGDADVDVMYFSVEGGASVQETFSGLQTKLLYLMTLLQSADEPATKAQVESVRSEQSVLRSMLGWWDGVWGTTLPDFNRQLEAMGMGRLEVR